MENAINVAHYISELLFRHDCVVVPGFGGFVCTYAPARIHPAQHTFTPPGKQIVFNKHLQQNDGLLAQTIASEISCSFDEAMTGIAAFAESVTAQLKSGKRVELHNIGTLSLDPEGNTSFEAYPEINYLVDSFGLGSFQSLPILREKPVVEKRKPVEKVDRPVEEKRPETPVEAIPVRPRSRRLLVTSAIVVPILAAAFWFTSQNTNAMAGFGIFTKKEASLYQHKDFFQPGPKEKLHPGIQADSNGIAKITLADNAPPIIVDIHKVAPDTTNVAQAQGLHHGLPVVNTKATGMYHIIGGCFGVPENAEKFAEQLRAKGYQPVSLDQVRSKLTHIAIASFNSKEEAEQFLQTIRVDIPNAWILRK